MFAQIGAQAGITTGHDLVNGILGTMLSQTGEIRIPIQKQETGYLSQIYAAAQEITTDADGNVTDDGKVET